MTGIQTDYVVLVNPKINKDRVYIPAEKMPERIRNQRAFFFIDTLKKVEGRVYRIKPDVKSYMVADD
ncbi:MAG: hypothetical protein WCV41_02990, partial [Patescibacteria group bacterium]